MDERNRKLVELVTEEVLKALSAPAPGPPGPPGSPGSPTIKPQQRAVVRPPIGQCTGDYSKFPELAGQFASAPTPTPVSAIALTGIVTANQLQEAMDKAPDGVAVLTNDARLTPLANDLARQLPQRIRRGEQALGNAPSATANWLWWLEGQCTAVTSLVSQRSHLLRAVGGTSLIQVVRNLATAVKSKQAAGGVLFVPNAARAMCYANRASTLRAVVGTCPQALEQGINELGANVLVIEYPYVKPDVMTTMMDHFINRSPSVPPNIQRELADLQRNG